MHSLLTANKLSRQAEFFNLTRPIFVKNPL